MSDYEAVLADQSGSGGSAGYGSGLIGGILDAAIGPVMANVQKGWSQRAARKAREWAEMMRSTAYQTTVKDLSAAGLNPALAYTRGETGTPSGPMASTPSIQQTGSFSKAIGSARQNMMVNEELRLLQTQRRGAEADTRFKELQANAGGFLAEQAKQNLEDTRASVRQRLKSAELNEEQAALASANAFLARKQFPAAEADASFYSTDLGTGIRWVDRAMGVIKPLVGAFQSGARRR